MSASDPYREEMIYRTLFESSPGLFVVLDPEHYRIQAVSNQYLKMTMRRREDLVGQIFFEAFPDDPDDPEKGGTANLKASLARVKSTLRADAMGIQKHSIVNPATGRMEPRYWTPLNAPVLDPDGALSMIIHSTEDVTALVQATGLTEGAQPRPDELPLLWQSLEIRRQSELLNASNVHLQGIIREASLGIAATDLDGRFIEANDAFCRLVGYKPQEIARLTVYDITHPDDVDSTRDMRTQLAEGGRRHFVIGKRYVTRTGSLIWVRLNASVLHDPHGNAIGMMAIVEDITAQRRAEQLLHQAGKIGRIGGWQVELHHGDVYWSPEVYALYEYEGNTPPSREEVFARYHPAYRQQVIQAIDKAWQDGEPFDVEFGITTFGGREKWVRLAGEGERDASGRVVRLLGASQDITSQRRDQDKLRQLSSQLFATLENMTDAFFLLDRDWRVLYMNAEAERILGSSRSGVQGANFWDVFEVFRDSPAYVGFREAAANGSAWHQQYFAPALSEWLEVSAYPTQDGLTVHFRSITAAKRMEQDVAISRERLRHITETVLDVVWDVDLATGQGWYNEGLKRKFGIDIGGKELDAQVWQERVHPEDKPLLLERFEALLREGKQNWSARYRFRDNSGNYLHVEDRGYIDHDSSGKPVRIVGGTTDVTARVRAEEHLMQTQRLESVGQLTGGIAHDFNNLLTVILGNIQLLHEELQGCDDLRKLTHAINVAANRGANLTRHLLAFSRRQALQPRSVSVNELLGSLRNLLARTLGEEVLIDTRVAPDLWPSLVDPGQLEVALLNLCINSRDAMPNGGILTLATRNTSLDKHYCATHDDVTPGDYVQITVTDTGCGMEPEILDRAFEPFFTTKEVGKGTGLGLSMVFGFIKQSCGHINIYSEPGQGTTIRLYLPRSNRSVGALDPESDRDRRATGGKEKILLVEDNELVRNYGMEQLRTLGYEVIGAAEGSEALDQLDRHPDVQLLFTDVVMPKMSGYELARQAQTLRPALRVLYTSGYTLDTVRRSGVPDKDLMLLEKPYGRAELAVKIRLALDADPGAGDGDGA